MPQDAAAAAAQQATSASSTAAQSVLQQGSQACPTAGLQQKVRCRSARSADSSTRGEERTTEREYVHRHADSSRLQPARLAVTFVSYRCLLHISVTDFCCTFSAQSGSRPLDRAVRACPADRTPAAKCVHMSHFRSGIHSCRQTGDDRVRPLFSQSRRAD